MGEAEHPGGTYGKRVTAGLQIPISDGGALDAARRLAAARQADDVLAALAWSLCELLGMNAVVNRLVEADDEYEVTLEMGDFSGLLGARYAQAGFEGLLQPAYAVAPGVYVIPEDAPEWADLRGPVAHTSTPSTGPGAWGDRCLALPLRNRAGAILAVVTADAPADGLVPGPARMTETALLSQFASTALEARLAEAAAAAAEREADGLMRIASSLGTGLAESEILERALAGLCGACDYGSGVISMLDEAGGVMETAAVHALKDSYALGRRFPADCITWAFARRFRLGDDSYLVTGGDAAAAGTRAAYSTSRTGRGHRGWNDHHLLLPLRGSDGALLGVAQVHDPADRMLPTHARVRRLEGFARQTALVLEASRHLSRARKEAMHDALTGLPNRTLLLDRVEHALARARREGSMVALLFIDLDGFKAVNDAHGHAVGDACLQAVAARLQAGMRPFDTLARLGGDEFVVLCDAVATSEEAGRIAQRILGALAAPLDLPTGQMRVGASVGLALAPRGDSTPIELLRAADVAMYHAKRAESAGVVGVDPGAGGLLRQTG